MNMIQKRQQMRGQSGFTLIELLVAIAILGILAGVAVFAVGGLTTQSKSAACKTELDTIKTANAAANATEIGTDGYKTFASADPKYYTVVLAPLVIPTPPPSPIPAGMGNSNARTALLGLTAEGTDAGCTLPTPNPIPA
ncbi:unannotated protein [freshwater metagenome]|uniref:Unannotated protein n=1 Tax=freshwater metagenome TaxID=449393 RepID=A0A6J7RYT7_9ZZZZ|nr:prepilin-type N-terminal cleavage/methylation domain-containing protein [Actinomycetota bacterium]